MTKLQVISNHNCDEGRFAAGQIFLMYNSWAENKNYKVSICWDSLTINFNRELPELEREAGIHRFCKISQFDPKKRRHTVFIKVLVNDKIDQDVFVRNYVFNPHQKIKDFISGVEVSGEEKVKRVMGGQIDCF